MPADTIFNDVTMLGRKFLQSASRDRQQLSGYISQLGEICALLVRIHTIVIRELEAIESAGTLQEAQAIGERLEAYPLTETFRAKGLCDIFQVLGQSLVRIARDPGGEGDSILSEQEREKWIDFCTCLEMREDGMGKLYSREIHEIIDVLSAQIGLEGLAAVQERATAAKDILTDERADFEALAKQFRTTIGL